MNTKIAVAVGLAAVLAAMFSIPQQAAFAADINVDITPGSSTKTTDAYAPNPVQAKVGDTVIWTNKDSQPHTATSGTASGGADGKFGGEAESFGTIIAPGKTLSHTFAEAGEFPYYCGLHPIMVGTVVVSAGGNGQAGGEFTTTATIDGKNFDVTGKSATVKATAATINPAGKLVKITFDKAGEVELTLPKTMISGINAVMAGDDTVQYEKSETDSTTTLKFTVPSGATEVDVMGTTVVPEFPVVAALILAASMVAIIGYTRFAKTGTGFLGRA